MRLSFTGLGTALVTPFTRSGALDEPATTRLAARQADAGVHFVVPCGTTGETPTLTEAEKIRVVELVAEAVEGRAMVLAGAGGYDTREVIHAIAVFERAGAHGILSVSPYYNKPTQEGLFQHYKALAESTRLPIIVYNVPGRTGSNVEPATLARLAEIPNIVGVKEASGNMSQIADVCRRVPSDFLVLSGDDALALPRDVDRRQGHHLGRVERGAVGNGADGGGGRAWRLRGGPPLAPGLDSLDARQFRRIESDSGEIRGVGDGLV